MSNTQPTGVEQLTKVQIARIFSMYWGCTYASKEMDEAFETINKERNVGFATIRNEENGALSGRKLLLKPLSAISDEDAIDVAKICGFIPLSNEFSVHRYGGKIWITEKGNDETCENKLLFNPNRFEFMLVSDNHPFDIEPISATEAFQHLIHQGYAVPLYIAPNHPLNGKTAIELGLALTPKEVNNDNV